METFVGEEGSRARGLTLVHGDWITAELCVLLSVSLGLLLCVSCEVGVGWIPPACMTC